MKLELLVALMLVRQRERPMDAASGGRSTELGAAVMSLPSGLLAMVCEAITKLESQLEVPCSECRAWPVAPATPANCASKAETYRTNPPTSSERGFDRSLVQFAIEVQRIDQSNKRVCSAVCHRLWPRLEIRLWVGCSLMLRDSE